MLHLVNDLGSDSIGGSQSDVPSLWPGTPLSYDFTLTPQAIRPVWVGVSADGTTNQVYPLSTSVATIIGAGWSHVYQGTEIVGANGDVLVFSEQYLHVLNALSACCATSVATAAFSLRQSNYSLDPDQPVPPCGVDALFKWLAVRGSAEARTLTYRFVAHLTTADGLTTQDVVYAADLAFTETLQLVKNWPADFAGLAEYALGTIGVEVVIKEAGSPVLTDLRTFRLPDICAEESGSSSSGESDSGSASASASSSAGNFFLIDSDGGHLLDSDGGSLLL